jgi:hypothetical protein
MAASTTSSHLWDFSVKMLAFLRQGAWHLVTLSALRFCGKLPAFWYVKVHGTL